MSFRGLRTGLAGGLILAALGAGPSHAGDGQHDHDRARQALEAGEVLPLRTILERVERDYPGQIMEVELEQKGERWIYEIKVLRAGGALVKLKIDGRDGRLLGSKGQQVKGSHRRMEP
ncbi:MAG: PepSY domain-containing protein [Betaproteobacteria bacterium]|nr:PepSY domain-containing protein [Betaproteobacteria bacterium]